MWDRSDEDQRDRQHQRRLTVPGDEREPAHWLPFLVFVVRFAADNAQISVGGTFEPEQTEVDEINLPVVKPEVPGQDSLRSKTRGMVQGDVLRQRGGDLDHQSMQREAPEGETYVQTQGGRRRLGIAEQGVDVRMKALDVHVSEETDPKIGICLEASHRKRPQHVPQARDHSLRLVTSDVLGAHEEVPATGLEQLG